MSADERRLMKRLQADERAKAESEKRIRENLEARRLREETLAARMRAEVNDCFYWGTVRPAHEPNRDSTGVISDHCRFCGVEMVPVPGEVAA